MKIYKKYRIGILGAQKVGKTSLIQRFTKNKILYEDSNTVEVESVYNMEYKKNNYELHIIETGGNHLYDNFIDYQLYTSDAFILVFSQQQEESLEKIINLYEKIINVKKRPIIFTEIIKNFSSNDFIASKIKALNCSYIRTDSHDNINVSTSFLMLLDILYETNIIIDKDIDKDIDKESIKSVIPLKRSKSSWLLGRKT